MPASDLKKKHAPAHGTLKHGATTLADGGTFTGSPQDVTYEPAADYNGGDSFKFQVTDRGDPDFFFNDTATTEIYPLSLHDALPISVAPVNDQPSALASPSSLSINED